ncbi:hypothetical protein L1987_54380 [Smallanthus sonchifolius]|uniref:Uncharacterized protein n=1 Tax=Smallanthus sonchifolius TaxID=185202 RepID=A0ACB9E7M8_9ASTR|nr:hypothetical protein L1987_54380 [Smallanthus sonchifolius]
MKPLSSWTCQIEGEGGGFTSMTRIGRIKAQYYHPSSVSKTLKWQWLGRKRVKQMKKSTTFLRAKVNHM